MVGGPMGTLEEITGSAGAGAGDPGPGGPGWHCSLNLLFSLLFAYSALALEAGPPHRGTPPRM